MTLWNFFQWCFYGKPTWRWNTRGHLIILMGKEGIFSTVCWQSKRISSGSECTGRRNTCSCWWDWPCHISVIPLLWTHHRKFHKGHLVADQCVTDNYSLVDAIKSTKSVTEKRLRLEISGIKELIQTKRIQHVLRSATNEQLADRPKKGASSLLLL